jgi:hypothetical protein
MQARILIAAILLSLALTGAALDALHVLAFNNVPVSGRTDALLQAAPGDKPETAGAARTR